MKTIQFLLALPTMLFFLGCQKNRQIDMRKMHNNSVQGPNDSGGGDTCNGKLIESYKVDITMLPEFKNYLEPILEKLISNNESPKPTSPFSFSAEMKNWYILDCKLKDIPSERKGLYIETYQTAIHTAREVFIDSLSYSSMSQQEKAKLLLHEMVMGHYLLKYLSLEQICKMSNSCNDDFIKVSRWKMFRPENYKPLGEEDHQKIRNVTAWLWSQKENLNTDSFLTFLKNNDFDKRFSVASDASENINKEIQIQHDVLVRMFKKYQWAKIFPGFCQFNLVTNLSESICEFSVNSEIRDIKFAENISLKHLSLKVKLTRNSDKKIFEQEFLYPLSGDKQQITLHMSKIGSVVNAAPLGMLANWPNQYGIEAVEGLKSQMLFMFLNVSDLNNPEIYQIFYQTYVWYSIENVFTEKDGVRYKETYGYASIIQNESETLFVENELPFLMNSAFFSGRTFLKSVIAP